MSRPIMLYLSGARIPGTRAISIQQMRMCEAFQQVGFDVELVYPSYTDRYDLPPDLDIWTYYAIDTRFNLCMLPSLLTDSKRINPVFSRTRIGGATMTMSFALDWLRRSLNLGRRDKRIIVYSRNIHASCVILSLQQILDRKVPHFYEIHRSDFGKSAWLHRWALPRFQGVISITSVLKHQLQNTFSIPVEKVVVAPDGVNLEAFNVNKFSLEESRRMLGLPPYPTRIVGYAGHLYPGRGGEELVKAAHQFGPEVIFVLVGGHTEDVERVCKLRDKLNLTNKVKLIGHVPPSKVPLFLACFDVLVAPYTTNFPIAKFTSPLKVFEYMASRRPMVIGHIPVLDDVLKDRYNCIFIRPGDVNDLVRGIDEALRDKQLSDQIAENANNDVCQYTWYKRALRIREFMEQKSDREVCNL